MHESPQNIFKHITHASGHGCSSFSPFFAPSDAYTEKRTASRCGRCGPSRFATHRVRGLFPDRYARWAAFSGWVSVPPRPWQDRKHGQGTFSWQARVSLESRGRVNAQAASCVGLAAREVGTSWVDELGRVWAWRHSQEAPNHLQNLFGRELVSPLCHELFMGNGLGVRRVATMLLLNRGDVEEKHIEKDGQKDEPIARPLIRLSHLFGWSSDMPLYQMLI